MTGYDDRYDRGPGVPPPEDAARVLERARRRVATPAVLLIVTGALTLLAALANVLNHDNVGPMFDQWADQVDQDPNMPADRKQKTKDLLAQLKASATSPTAFLSYAVAGVAGLLIALGGAKLRGLSGRGLAITGSVLAMTPCFSSCCCVLGLPAGIWAIAALAHPDVRAAYALRAVAAPPPPDQF